MIDHEPAGHAELMATQFVVDTAGNVWATNNVDRQNDFKNAKLVALSEFVEPKFAHIVSAGPALYHMNFHAGEMIEQHVATLERAGLDELAVAFVQMAANLKLARRMATEGIRTLTDKKDRGKG